MRHSSITLEVHFSKVWKLLLRRLHHSDDIRVKSYVRIILGTLYNIPVPLPIHHTLSPVQVLPALARVRAAADGAAAVPAGRGPAATRLAAAARPRQARHAARAAARLDTRPHRPSARHRLRSEVCQEFPRRAARIRQVRRSVARDVVWPGRHNVGINSGM